MEKTNLTSPQSVAVDPELLTRSEVAQLLHVSLSYVDHLPDLPCFKLGKKKLFSKSEILNYLHRNHVQSSTRKVSKTDAIRNREAPNVEN